jgi:hypothetical protein
LDARFCNGELRYLRVGELEVVRRVHVAVRDTGWGTVPPVISGVRLDCGGQGFQAEYHARHSQGDIDFRWTGRIEGLATTRRGRTESSIVFEMEGVAEKTFQTCRTGICLLHPLRHCIGVECAIAHSDGRVELGRFPDHIAARQPFTDIVAMSQSFPDGLELKIEFRGEVFETEDQRNWADGSFKTYCRPLSMPFPYVLERGQRLSQSVKITVTGGTVKEAPAHQTLTLSSAPIGCFPGAGLTVNGGLSVSDRERLRGLRLSHVRVNVDLMNADWRADFLKAMWQVKALGLAAEIAVHADEDFDPALEELARLADGSGAVVRRWIAYEVRKPTPSTELLRAADRHLSPAPLAGGTVGSFAELNRKPPNGDLIRALAYSINPQVHASDDFTLIENLEAQADTVRTAKAIVTGAAVSVGPVTLHRRPDPFAAGKSGEEEPAPPDSRQRTMFGAVWTLGSMAALCRAGPDAITYYDAVGSSGVMERGEVFPIYRVLADVGEFAGGEVLECRGLDPLKGTALALRKGDRIRVIVGSFGEELPMLLSGFDGFRVTRASSFTSDNIRPLDVLPTPLVLPPFSIVRLDLESKGGPQR